MKLNINWEWDDFGIVLRLSRTILHSDYKFMLDFQIAWFNVWIQFIKR